MTKEEAIKRLKSDIYEYADFTENPNENEFWTAFDMAIEALERADLEGYSSRLWKAAYERGKAEAEQRWIPVSERLPEDHRWVLCSCVASMYEVLTLTNRGWEDGYDKCYMKSFVLAWCELPEHYKAESEEV